ncbi:hypothetical protein HU200_022288 [Digitaria exilis]|uniref:F-box domain-containing protein n=1 Tax=Digitaria exilis TaxID=1010633 RepID=A0A835EYS4_9POAL|nr:hypothetical protein HU200_022288 [Digitaria exilis]
MAESNVGAQDLPDEVLTEILARLPAKSAGRFRCVSRAWSDMLSSDYFVDLHLRRANRPDRPKLLLTAIGSSYDGYLYSWQPGGEVDKLMPDEFGGDVTVPLTKPCRGLILVRARNYGDDDGGYLVFNPSTGQALALPDSEKPLKTKFRRRNSRWDIPNLPFYIMVSYGLGYCTIKREYKVVRLFSNRRHEPEDGDDDTTPARAEIFVLNGTPGYWRPSAENPLLYSVKEDPAVFLDGYLHFLCDDGRIATFNISDETFGSLLLPPPGFEDVASVLTELDGCLCLCYGEPDTEDPIHVCLLRDYKEARWEKLCCIDRAAWSESERTIFNSFWIAPIGTEYSGGEQKIVFGTGSCNVLAVDPDGGDPEILFTPDDTIVGSCDDDFVPACILLEESLAPVGVPMEDLICSSPTTKAWFDILKWLPARSVLEMRLVCREWRAMTMTDSFIHSHVIHANLKRSPLIKVILDPRSGLYIDLEEWTGRDGHYKDVGLVCSQPCHGLNVGSCQFWDFVCNPTMSYCEHIDFDDNDGTFFAGRIGLGYNTETCKHVMVHITYKTKNPETRHYELQCRMKYVDGCEWDPINPPSRPVAATPPTFVNGKIYWIVDPNIGPVSARCELIAFNVQTEQFEVLQGPPCTHGGGHMAILELQGALCISYSDQSRNTVDLWMMKDDRIWLMEYHIVLDKLAENVAPLAVDPTDGRILLNTGLSLGYYDPNTEAFETIYTHAFPKIQISPIVCHESLVCPLN